MTPRAPDPYAPDTLARLTRDARAVSASVRGMLGLAPDDLVGAGWLAYVAAAARGLSHASCCTRARFAMVDAVRVWGGAPFCHRTGARLAALVSLADYLVDFPSGERPAHPRFDAVALHGRLVPVVDVLVAPTSPPKATRTRLPRAVRRALDGLTPAHRTALHDWCVRGWDAATSADAAGVSPAVMATRRCQAVYRLRAAVGAPCDTPRRRNTHRVLARPARELPPAAARPVSCVSL